MNIQALALAFLAATAIGLLMAGATLPPELLNPAITSGPAPAMKDSLLNRLTRRWL